MLAKKSVCSQTPAPVRIASRLQMKACGSAGEWQHALHLFSEMRAIGIPPTELCFTAVIRACAKADEVSLCGTALCAVNALSLPPILLPTFGIVGANTCVACLVGTRCCAMTDPLIMRTFDTHRVATESLSRKGRLDISASERCVLPSHENRHLDSRDGCRFFYSCLLYIAEEPLDDFRSRPSLLTVQLSTVASSSSVP